MLNYWRTTAGGAATFFTGNSRPTANNTPIPAASPFSDYGFDGPFFDLEFTLFDDEVSETTETRSGSGNLSEDPDEEMREIELNLDIEDQDFKISLFCKNSLLEETKITEQSEKSEAADNNNKVVRLKFEVDQVKGPLISLFARDYSISQDSNTSPANQGKEMLQKYLNILKPLYMRLHTVSPAKAGARSNNLQKVVRKHLGKSRSTPTAEVSSSGSNRRDDSLQDGIQGAILYCKRSFNSERGKDYNDS